MRSPRAEAQQDPVWTLGLPLRTGPSLWLAVVALAVYYAASMCRDLALYDSGELALAAVRLGVGHPPGQPLHTLVGFALAQLTGGTPLLGVNLASALPAALTLLPGISLAQTLAGPRVPGPALAAMPWLGAATAVHVCLWEPATRTEVYALATLCAVWAVACALPAAAGRHAPPLAAALVFRASVALGLCASANPLIAVGVATALLPALLHASMRRLLPWSAFGHACLGGALGLTPYAYLPIAAARKQAFVWGGLHDAASYVRYMTLRDYAHNQTIDIATWLTHAAGWFDWAARQLLLPLLILGLAGHLRASFRVGLGRAIAPLAFLWLLLFISFNVVWNLDVPDYNGYMASAYWLFSAGALALWAGAWRAGRPIAVTVIAACLLLSALAPPNPAARTRQRDRLARDLAQHVLNEAPARAIVIAMADHFAGSLFYLQEVEGKRRDVSVLAYGLSGSSWHWEQLWRLHPDLQRAALRGPDGKAGRVRRWLAANGGRPVLVERLQMANELGLTACSGGLYLRTGALCAQPSEQAPATAAFLAHQLATLSTGAPSTQGAIADVSCGIGEALWRLGRARQAHDMLLAGVPKGDWPVQLAASVLLAQVPAFNGPAPTWQRTAALGDPARNLFLAGAIVDASGQSEASRAYLQAAARAGLPEARTLLMSIGALR